MAKNKEYSTMGFWKTLFGGAELSPEEEKKNAEAKNFDLLKYDGVKAMRMGQTDYAVKCYRKALEIQDDLETRDYLQQALTRQGNLDEAVAELKVMAQAQPENVSLWQRIAHLAYQEENYDEMLEACQQAEQADAENAEVNYQYAQAYLGKQDLINGIARLTKAVALDENLLDARLLRGQTLLKMSELNGAAEDANYLLERTEEQEDVLMLCARLEHAKGDDDKAISFYDRVIEANPFHLDAFRERGKIKFDKGDKQGAEEDMQKVLELNPKETSDVSGDYSAEGVEQRVKQAYSNMNPFGI